MLSGTNRHTITPTGWVQEEDNLKVVLDEEGSPRESQPYLAREAGLNRYERIVGHDFSAGDDYWEQTAAYWADVRAAWDVTFEQRGTFTLKSKVDGKRLFEKMFAFAEELRVNGEYDATQGRAFIKETLANYLD